MADVNKAIDDKENEKINYCNELSEKLNNNNTITTSINNDISSEITFLIDRIHQMEIEMKKLKVETSIEMNRVDRKIENESKRVDQLEIRTSKLEDEIIRVNL